MSRPRAPYIRADYKLSIPAELAGRIDLTLEDPLTHKPKYGARARLTEKLYRIWLAHVNGDPVPPFPSVAELRESEA